MLLADTDPELQPVLRCLMSPLVAVQEEALASPVLSRLLLGPEASVGRLAEV